MKKSTVIYLVLAVVIAGAVYYYTQIKTPEFLKKEPTTNPNQATPVSTTNSANSSKPVTDNTFDASKVLKRGSKGKNVQFVQKALNRIFKLEEKSSIAVDGDFGPATEKALVSAMGKKSASYSEVKSEVIRRFKAKGKANPYISNNNSNTEKEEDFSGLLWETVLNTIGLDFDPFS